MQLATYAPARICLFGDHQDYLGLPVIACAINRKITITSEKNTTNLLRIEMPNISSTRSISISDTFETLPKHDHIASALRVLRRIGCIPNCGYDITITGDIPINAGVSSSSALAVAWIHFLLKAFGNYKNIPLSKIAQLAYEAEVLEHNAPGGRMDQYTSAIGNILYIDTSKSLAFETLGTSLDGMILAESGIPKETIRLLSEVRTNTELAIAQVTKHYPDFDLKEAKPSDVESFSEVLPKKLLPFFKAAIQNHAITQQALAEFKRTNINLSTLGKLMTQHHNVLRDELRITVPKIDNLAEAALNAGAFGAKMVGSGGGGSVVALASEENKKAVIDAFKTTGAKDAYPVYVTKGTH